MSGFNQRRPNVRRRLGPNKYSDEESIQENTSGEDEENEESNLDDKGNQPTDKPEPKTQDNPNKVPEEDNTTEKPENKNIIEDESSSGSTGYTQGSRYVESQQVGGESTIIHNWYETKRSKWWWLRCLCCLIIIGLLIWILYCLYSGCHHKNEKNIYNNNTYYVNGKMVEDNNTKIIYINKCEEQKDNIVNASPLKLQEPIVDPSRKVKPVVKPEVQKKEEVTPPSTKKDKKEISILTEAFQPHVLPRKLDKKLITIPAGKVSYTGVNGKKYSQNVKAFKVMSTEVTVKDYFYFANDEESHYPDFWNKSDNDLRRNINSIYKDMCLNNECPIIGVSYADVSNYISWLNSRTRGRYTLLTEAQWHRIASYKDLNKEVWYKENSRGTNRGVKEAYPNKFGIYGSYGNVAEMAMGDEDSIILLGGSWKNEKNELEKSKIVTSSYKNNDVGFRLVIAPK